MSRGHVQLVHLQCMHIHIHVHVDVCSFCLCKCMYYAHDFYMYICSIERYVARSHSGAHIFVEPCKHASHIVVQLVEHLHGSALKKLPRVCCLLCCVALHIIMINLTCMYK